MELPMGDVTVCGIMSLDDELFVLLVQNANHVCLLHQRLPTTASHLDLSQTANCAYDIYACACRTIMTTAHRHVTYTLELQVSGTYWVNRVVCQKRHAAICLPHAGVGQANLLR